MTNNQLLVYQSIQITQNWKGSRGCRGIADPIPYFRPVLTFFFLGLEVNSVQNIQCRNMHKSFFSHQQRGTAQPLCFGLYIKIKITHDYSLEIYLYWKLLISVVGHLKCMTLRGCLMVNKSLITYPRLALSKKNMCVPG